MSAGADRDDPHPAVSFFATLINNRPVLILRSSEIDNWWRPDAHACNEPALQGCQLHSWTTRTGEAGWKMQPEVWPEGRTNRTESGHVERHVCAMPRWWRFPITKICKKKKTSFSKQFNNLAILCFTCLHAVLRFQLKALRSSPYNIWNIKYYDVITALWGHFKRDITIFSVVGVFCTDLEGSFTLLCSQPGNKGDEKHEKKGIIRTRNRTNAAKWIKNTRNRTDYTCFLLNSQCYKSQVNECGFVPVALTSN